LIFELWKEWRPYGLNEIGVEKKAYEDEIKPLLDLEKQRRQVFPIVTELKPLQTSKRNRIKGNLEGLYETGKIWTIVDEMGNPIEDTEKLYNELYNFPNAKNDDLSDAEAYITDMVQIPEEQEINTIVDGIDWGMNKPKSTEPNDDPFN
jgi:hypothetical protein